MSVPQARKLVSDATVSLVRIVASAVASGPSPVKGDRQRGASEANPWFDVDLWTLM